jgi:NitT/TauT family transport system substrate-binding protein
MFLSASARDSFWPWLKAKYGFTDDQFRSYANSAPFVKEKRSIQQGYLSSEPNTIEQQAHFKPAVFLLADEGFPGYAAMVLAPDSLIARNPAAIRAFNEASAAGWKSYLYGDPKPGDALILRDNPEITPAVLAQARDKMRQYAIVAPDGSGAMTDARWADFFKVASEQGVYPNDMDYRAAYSLEFAGNRAP